MIYIVPVGAGAPPPAITVFIIGISSLLYKQTTFTVIALLGVVVQVNVKLFAACAVHKIPADA
jgi:hypothetical protein